MNAWWRFLATVLATAIVINLTWTLIRPAIPFLAGLILVLALLHWLRWYRGRW